MSAAARRIFCAAAILAVGAVAVQAEPAGVFVAVGYGGRRISSRDGAVWENDQRWSDESRDNDDVLFGVAYGLGRFVAVGGGSKIGHILTTRDGRDWAALPEWKGRVCPISFGRDRFVAAHDAEVLVSMDGERFSAGERLPWPGSIHPRRSACGDTEAGYRFVVIGDVDLWAEKKRVSWRAVTSDGSRWDHTVLDTPAARDIAYGAGHFVAVGPAGLAETSHDGQNWQRVATDGLEDFSRVVWTGQRFIASGARSLWSSPDGFAWTRESATPPAPVFWGRERALGVGFAWGGGAFWTTDFRNWKRATLPPGPSLNAVAFGLP